MADFEFQSVSFTNINKDGTALSSTLTFTPSTAPAGGVLQFAIGNRVRMSLVVYGVDYTSTTMRVNMALWGLTVGATQDWGFETYGFIDGTATQGVFVGPTDGLSITRRNIESVSFQLISANEAEIIIDFYITCDVLDYIRDTYFVNNQVRLLQSRLDSFSNQMQNFGISAYSVLSFLGLSVLVNDSSGTAKYAQDPVTLRDFWQFNWANRWYNSDYPEWNGSTWVVPVSQRRWMKQITAECPSQVAAGLPKITHFGAPSFMSSQGQNTDSMFTYLPFGLRNQLAYNEKNTIEITLNGFADSSLTPKIVDNIRVLVIRTDRFQNNLLFTDNYSMSEAIIPPLDGSTTQLDGCIYTPSVWTWNNITNQIDIQFDIDGSLLDLGREYRVIVNVYEDANPGNVTSHVSPPLYVQYVPPAIPDIDGYLGTYAQEYATNELQDVAPHQRIRARLEIDKASYAAALSALGFTSTFDACFFSISAELIGIPSVIAGTTETYQKNTLTLPLNNGILTNGMQIVTDSVGVFSAAATFRIEEERAGTTGSILWTVTMRQPNYVPGSFTVVQIQFEQLLGISTFENDDLTPELIAVRFLDADEYPTTKIDIRDICDRDKILVEVEKDGALLSGSVNLIATIYPASATGDTTNPSIEEEESWTPSAIILPLKLSGKLDNVEASFGGDNFATFEINAQQLVQGQQYFVTAIAIDQFPDYCPIGLVSDTIISTFRTGTAVPGWVVAMNYSALIGEIIAHPDYVVGTYNVVSARIVDSLGNPVGVQTTGLFAIAAQLINPALTEVYCELVIDADFAPGFVPPHTIRHTLNVTVPRPAVNAGTFNYDSNAYVCSDLG